MQSGFYKMCVLKRKKKTSVYSFVDLINVGDFSIP